MTKLEEDFEAWLALQDEAHKPLILAQREAAIAAFAARTVEQPMQVMAMQASHEMSAAESEGAQLIKRKTAGKE